MHRVLAKMVFQLGGLQKEKNATHVSSCSPDCSPCIRNYCSFTGTKKQWFVLMAIFIFPFTLDNDI